MSEELENQVDETTGVETQEAAENQTGEPTQTPEAEGQPSTQEETTVPLAALEAERQKRQQAEAMYYQALQQQAQQMQQPQGQADQDVFGVRPEDLYDENGFQRFQQNVQKLIQDKVQQGIAQYGTQQFLAQHPEFGQVVGQSYGNQFVPAPAFQAACQKDPYLQQAVNGLLAAGNQLGAMQLAYSKAKEASAPTQNQRFNVPGPAEQTSAAIGPTSPTSVGGGGAFGAAQRVGEMSDEEFVKLDREASGTV